MTTKRAAIVGAGPGGLAAAMLLANAGLEVDVFERLGRVGGRTTTFELDGFRFDLGPTFFLYPRVLEEVFRLVGRDLHEEVPMERLDPQYRVSFLDGPNVDATADIDAMAKQLAQFDEHDAQAFAGFMAENRGKLAAFRPVLETQFDGWADLLRPEVLSLLPQTRPWNTLDRELRRHFRDPRVRIAFSFQAKYLGMSPFRCPSIFSILSHLEYEHGVWHPMGGFGQLSQAMADVAQQLGARIHLDAPVDELLYEGRRATGLVSRGVEHQFDAVVVNADFAATVPKLVPDRMRSRWTDKKLESARYSCSTFMLYLGIDGTVDLPHHTIAIPTDYRQNLREIEELQVLSADPAVYVQNACATDPGQAPEGSSGLYVLAPVPNRSPNVDWARDAQAFRATVMRQLERLGIENLEARIRTERMITPDEWEQRYGVHKGAVFNLAHDLKQMLHLRPHNRFEDVDGMYLVGGGTHPGSGLPVIYESARISSRLVCEDLGIDADWNVPPAGVRRLTDVA